METYVTLQLYAILLLFYSIFFASYAHRQPFILNNINENEYQRMVDTAEHFLVNFGTAGCVRCKDLEPHYIEVFEHYMNNPSVDVVKMNDINMIRKLGLPRVPSILFYRHGVPILYEGQMTSEDILFWMEENFESFTINLKDDDFEHLTQSSSGSTTGDWLVQFCYPDVPRCIALEPVWESTAYKLKGKINVAKVNMTDNPKLEKRFKIKDKDVPVILFFRHGKQYEYTISQKNSGSLITFSEAGYKHAQGIDIMPPPSPFDDLTESIALQIKGFLNSDGSSPVLLIVGMLLALVVIVLVVCCCCCCGGNNIQQMEKTKKSV